MGVLYTMASGNSMLISQNKSELDAMRRTDEIVIPVGDTERRIGWTLMPVSEYVRARYIEHVVKS